MTTHERLQVLLEKELGLTAERLGSEAKLEDLGVDSLQMIEIVFCVEDAFDIKVDLEPAGLRERLTTFGDLVKLIDEHVALRRAPEKAVP